MADYARPEMLVEPAWLQAHLGDPSLRLVDCDLPDAYRRAHIEGAVCYTGPDDHYYKQVADRRFVMQPEEFAAAMASLGIGDDSEVIAYDASGSLYAARLWWCLNYYGHQRVRILNGGWQHWLQAGLPVSLDVPKIVAGAGFTPHANEALRATAEDVMAAIEKPGVVILDVRSDAEWLGENDRGNRRAGRIPGSVHLEWLNNVQNDASRCLKPADELRAQLAAIGVTPDQEVVTLCQGGIRAAQMAMTLTLLGYERVRDYDGSFLEWGNRDDTPIVK